MKKDHKGQNNQNRPHKENDTQPEKKGRQKSKTQENRKNNDAIKGAVKNKVPAPATEHAKAERIAKVMARAGLCSRREAERWIVDGRVTVNGAVLESPACVVTEFDAVIVDGKPLPQKEPMRLFLYHKTAGLVTTARDEYGRDTVFDKLPATLPRVVSVGRLDLNTEGLLLLTNDGALARYLELPSTGWKRRYRVRAYGKVSQEKLDSLKNGITVDGVNYGAIEALLEKEQGGNSWLSMTLREGKNREIRNVMEALDMKVNRLIRVSYGPFHLGDLQKGAVKEVPAHVIKAQTKGFQS